MRWDSKSPECNAEAGSWVFVNTVPLDMVAPFGKKLIINPCNPTLTISKNMNISNPVLTALRTETFNVDDYSLAELSNAFNEVRAGFIRARKLLDKKERDSAFADLSVYSNRVMKATARKWAKKGARELERKIADLEKKEADPERSLNPYDSVLLEFLRKESKEE